MNSENVTWAASWRVLVVIQQLAGLGTCTPQLLKQVKRLGRKQTSLVLFVTVVERIASHSLLRSQDLLDSFSGVTSAQRKAGTLISDSSSHNLPTFLSADYL